MNTKSPAPPTPPTAQASMDYERPLDTVRAEFFDVDHAVRDRIYRGIRLSWLVPKAPGERRLRQDVRVMDRVLSEEIVIEEGEGGSFVKRFVEGPNTGTRFVGSFFAEGPQRTRVDLAAFAGPRGFAMGLGKLSPLGLEKALRKILGEHKLALEGYVPGRARGAVVAVIAGWTPLTAPVSRMREADRRSVVGLVLETACSMMVIDEPADAAEREAMLAVVSALWNVQVAPDVEQRMVDHAAQSLASEGIEARCDSIGARLKAFGVSELGVSVAVLVAEVSHGLDVRELLGLRRLATAAGIGEARLGALVEKIDAELTGDEGSRLSVFI